MKKPHRDSPGARGDGRAAETAALAEVRAVYAELERRPAERGCVRQTGCCQFRLTGLVPSLTPAEARLLARGWRAAGRTRPPEEPADGACPLFDPLRQGCRVYESRPFGCRTHFCAAAGGPRSRREVLDLIRRLEEASERFLGDREPRPLPAALRRAMEER